MVEKKLFFSNWTVEVEDWKENVLPVLDLEVGAKNTA